MFNKSDWYSMTHIFQNISRLKHDNSGLFNFILEYYYEETKAVRII